MPHLLFELGCEELPAGGIPKALDQLVNELNNRLSEAGLEFGDIHTGCTPRRLVVGIDGLPETQPNMSKEVRGPSVKAAYEANGEPSKALLGFLRGQGANPDQVRKEGDYVVVTVYIPGRSTSDVLAEILPECIKSLTFDKTMRWGTARMRFARPIRWILAAFDGEIVPFAVESVASGLESRGHRFDHPAQFAATDFADLKKKLHMCHVEIDPVVRQRIIREQAAKATAFVPDLPDSLVEENVFLTEWPNCHEGTFSESFMELPAAVVVTAMVKHERFFPVRDGDGKLVNHFVSVRNGGDEATVRKGNEWVLNARLNDAKFFFDEDSALTMDDFLAKTDRMVFQEGLGSVRQRADRLASLCQTIAVGTSADKDELEAARLAGFYAKADLATGLVGELASLQGVVGAIYARREGLPDPVCGALKHQYQPQAVLPPDCPGGRTAVRLALADQIDKLTGFVGTGIKPSGSSDPFGLRRAVSVIIEIAWNWDGAEDTRPWFAAAQKLYGSDGLGIDDAVFASMEEIFHGRYESLLGDYSSDVIKAATSGANLFNPRLVQWRVEAGEALKAKRDLVQTLSRPVNIARAAEQKGFAVTGGDHGKLESVEGVRLYQQVGAAESAMGIGKSISACIEILEQLAEPTNKFFDAVMVMAEDEAVRTARLTLVARVRDIVLQVCDISQLTFD